MRWVHGPRERRSYGTSLTSTDYDATYEDSRRTHVQYADNRTSLLRVRRRSASRGAPGHMSVAIEDSHINIMLAGSFGTKGCDGNTFIT